MTNGIAAQENKPWLVMLYIATDDINPEKPEERSIAPRCKEMLKNLETQPLDPNVNLAVLFDAGETYPPSIKFRNPNNQWDDQTDIVCETEQIFFYRGKNGQRALNTGNFYTLADFIQWARKTYEGRYGTNPDHTLLSIIGHGGGWAPTLKSHQKLTPFVEPRLVPLIPQKGDGANWGPSLNGLCPDYSAKSAISTKELGKALEGNHLDVLFLDACLMGMIEVACEIQKYVDYLIVGENLLYAQFPYDSYLAPGVLTSPEGFAKSVVTLYNKQGQQQAWSIAAIKTANLSELISSVDKLAEELIAAIDQDAIVVNSIYNAYDACQKFDYDGDGKINKKKDAYVDLYDFARQLIEQVKSDNRLDGIKETGTKVRCFLRGEEPYSRIEPDTSWMANCKEPSVVSRVKPQSDARKPDVNLDDAYGVAIYLPLGELEDRRRDVQPRDLLDKPYLDYYVDVDQLAFAKEAKHWAKLLAILTSNIPSGRSLIRDPAKPAYRTPRQLLE